MQEESSEPGKDPESRHAAKRLYPALGHRTPCRRSSRSLLPTEKFPARSATNCRSRADFLPIRRIRLPGFSWSSLPISLQAGKSALRYRFAPDWVAHQTVSPENMISPSGWLAGESGAVLRDFARGWSEPRVRASEKSRISRPFSTHFSGPKNLTASAPCIVRQQTPESAPSPASRVVRWPAVCRSTLDCAMRVGAAAPSLAAISLWVS